MVACLRCGSPRPMTSGSDARWFYPCQCRRMLATYAAPVVTRYTLEQMAYALKVGLTSVLGHRPSNPVVAVAMAKCRLETGNGNAVWNHNLGNVKKPANEVGNYTCIKLNEVIDGGLQWFAPEGRLTGDWRKGGVLKDQLSPVPPGHAQTRMNSLAGPTDAGYFYIDFVCGRARYAKARDAMLAGNPELYARYLGEAGYYTAPIEQYTKTVMALYAPSLLLLEGKPYSDVHAPDRHDYYNQLALDGFLIAEMDRELNEGPTAGRALLDYEQTEESGSGGEPVA